MEKINHILRRKLFKWKNDVGLKKIIYCCFQTLSRCSRDIPWNSRSRSRLWRKEIYSTGQLIISTILAAITSEFVHDFIVPFSALVLAGFKVAYVGFQIQFYNENCLVLDSINIFKSCCRTFLIHLKLKERFEWGRNFVYRRMIPRRPQRRNGEGENIQLRPIRATPLTRVRTELNLLRTRQIKNISTEPDPRNLPSLFKQVWPNCFYHTWFTWKDA